MLTSFCSPVLHFITVAGGFRFTILPSVAFNMAYTPAIFLPKVFVLITSNRSASRVRGTILPFQT